jgi:hypothetical protein
MSWCPPAQAIFARKSERRRTGWRDGVVFMPDLP